MNTVSRSEFSVIKKLPELRQSSANGTISADKDQLRALAKRFDLRSINSLSADYSLEPKDDRIQFTGTITSDLVQVCALSGQDLPVQIKEGFDIAFVDQLASEAEEQEIELTAEDCDIMEYRDGKIDIGEAIAQTLYLALDPYATAPGAEEIAREKGLKTKEEAGPFGALAALKGKLE